MKIIHAASACDSAGRLFAPAAMLFQGQTLIAAGTPQEIGMNAHAEMVARPRSVLIAPMVNAHTHLDLTDVATVELDRESPGGFMRWLAEIARRRASAAAGASASERAAGVRTAVEHGAQLCLRGGVGWVGDIAGPGLSEAFDALAQSAVGGVCFCEVLGISGEREASALALIASLKARSVNGVTLGVQPHALYSASDKVFEAAMRCGLVVSTHLAESAAETEFALHARGECVELLRKVGAWNDSIAPRGVSPVEWFTRLKNKHAMRAVAAHVNEITDHEIALLAASGVSVAYCPRSNAFLNRPGQEGGAHRWQDMLKAGVCVAIGTDGVVSLAAHEYAQRLSPLDELALLHSRASVKATTLLAMATTNGLSALGISNDVGLLVPGWKRGWLAVTSPRGDGTLASIFDSSSEIEWVVDGEKIPPII